MPDNTGTQQNAEAGKQAEQSQPPASFTDWIKAQPDDIQALYEEDVKGLRSSVQAVRSERENLAKQLRDAHAKLEKGSDAEKVIAEVTAKYEMAERRATFMEEAVKPEIGCLNPKAAFVLAQGDGLFDRKGNPDWSAIRAAVPELFRGSRQPAGNAGSGAGQEGAPTKTMNAFIRKAAGKM